jgi:hypothetical protein
MKRKVEADLDEPAIGRFLMLCGNPLQFKGESTCQRQVSLHNHR